MEPWRAQEFLLLQRFVSAAEEAGFCHTRAALVELQDALIDEWSCELDCERDAVEDVQRRSE
jgi:hypothetical protein